jgi:hypothetical protein
VDALEDEGEVLAGAAEGAVNCFCICKIISCMRAISASFCLRIFSLEVLVLTRAPPAPLGLAAVSRATAWLTTACASVAVDVWHSRPKRVRN